MLIGIFWHWSFLVGDVYLLTYAGASPQVVTVVVGSVVAAVACAMLDSEIT